MYLQYISRNKGKKICFNGTDHSWNWPLFDWNSAQETEKRLSGENIARGLANAWERPCVTSQTTLPPPKQCKHLEAAVWEARKVGGWKKTRQNFPRNTELSSFQMTSIHQVICCIANSNWKLIDMYKDQVQSKAHVKNKENIRLHTLANGILV